MKFTLYSDGACVIPSGGYAAVVNDHYVISGSATDTTNNIMEIAGIYEGIKFIKENLLPSKRHKIHVTVYSDSAYAIGVLSEKMKAKKNIDLVNEVRQYIRDNNITVTWQWIKGHSGIPQNEQADKIAVNAMKMNINNNVNYNKVHFPTLFDDLV